MDTLKLCGGAVAAAFAAMLLREFGGRSTEGGVRLAATVGLFCTAAAMISPIVEFIRSGGSAAGENSEVLTHALGVALAVRLSADICRECGAVGVASALELVGRVELLLLALPLISEVMQIVTAMAGG